jgi:hypothetical protein
MLAGADVHGERHFRREVGGDGFAPSTAVRSGRCRAMLSRGAFFDAGAAGWGCGLGLTLGLSARLAKRLICSHSLMCGCGHVHIAMVHSEAP